MASANLALPEGFANLVRIFPLPNLVLFPGLVQALHIFEPRYQQLMTDCLESDQLISMALLQPPEISSAQTVLEPIYSTVCVGKVVSHAKTSDGRYNLILAGICRARVIDEISFQTPYRIARVELPEEIELESADEERRLRQEIANLFRQVIAVSAETAASPAAQWLDLKLPLGHLCDVVAFSIASNPLDQQRVLETFDIQRRAELVIELLQRPRETETAANRFPPDFSLN